MGIGERERALWSPMYMVGVLLFLFCGILERRMEGLGILVHCVPHGLRGFLESIERVSIQKSENLED